MNERRRARRRNLPFVRSAVLEVGGRNHIVSVADVGPEGAFLCTRLSVDPHEPLRLRIVLPGESREVVMPCQMVRRSDRPGAAPGRGTGIAVRFPDLDDGIARRLAEFSGEGMKAAANPAPAGERFEYRSLERPGVDIGELNRLGAEGWRLVTALPSAEGVRMVLLRRL